MGWQDWRKSHADDTNKSAGGGRRFDPWQAKNMLISAGDDFEVLVCDRPPHSRPHHWVAKLPHECTGHLDVFGGRCAICVDAERLDAENGVLEAAGKQPIEFRHRKKDQFVIPVVDLRMHHFIPDENKPGKFTTAACAYTELDVTPGGPPLCAHCKSQDAYVATRRFLGVRRWEIDDYSDLWKAVKDADRQAAGTCLHTYADGSVCGGKTWIMAVICPECGHEHMDSEGAHKNMQETISFYEHLQTCPSCDVKKKPYVVYGCHNSAKRGKGSPEHETVPGSLVSGGLHIHCYGESKTTKGETKVIRKFNVTPLPMRDRLALVMGYGATEAEAKKLLTAEDIDLDAAYLPEGFKVNPRDAKYQKNGAFDMETYTADVLQAQSEALGIPNPFTGKSTTTSRPFQAGSRRTYQPEGEGGGDRRD